MLDLGLTVSGSDLKANAAVRQLQTRGADIREGHSPEHLAASRPSLVIYTSAIRRDNPALRRAEQLGVPLLRRAVVLAALLRNHRGVCVAGMHGKTSTTALLAYVLRELDAETGYAVGGEVPQWERAAQLPTGNGFFTVEADESDGTLCEFHPEQAIVLNVDEEHVDYFSNLEEVCAEFAVFADQTLGTVFYCADDPRLVELFARRPGAISYGVNPAAQYRVESLLSVGADSSFELWYGADRIGGFQLALFGAQHISNAAAAAAFLHHNGFEMEAVAAAMASFRGVGRRQQLLFGHRDIRVFDDYGHHPREIEATLSALRGLRTERVLAAFQPHRYTRTQHLLEDFATCFTGADQVWVTDVYSAGEQEIPEVNGARLASAVAKQGTLAAFAPTLSRLREQVCMVAQPGDVIVFFGAGDITQVAQQVAIDLAADSESATKALSALLSPDSLVNTNEPMAKHTTLRVGGSADFFVEAASEADLAKVLKFCVARELPLLVLGRGSNLLVRDGGIRGVVVSLAHEAFARFEMREDRIFAGACVRLKTLANEARKAGLAGLEFLEGIPGSLGGALCMNAGAMGSMIFDVVESIRFIDRMGGIHTRPASEIESVYRSCPLLKGNIALSAVLRGEPSSDKEVAERMREFSEKRIASQPGARSAGCIFKNPEICPAGRLVDELGLKGERVGDAMVSEAHGNFIINGGNATATDMLELIEMIQERAWAERGVRLQTEVQIVGE